MKHLLTSTAIAAALCAGCDGAVTSDSLAGDGSGRLPTLTAPTDVRFGAPPIVDDAGVDPTPPPTTADAGVAPTPPAPADAGTPSTTPEPDPAPEPPPTSSVRAGCECVRADLMWSDGFESGDHSAWTGRGYGEPWGDHCQSTAITTEHPHSGRYAQRSEIVCPSSSPEGVHRGYGGLQWGGDTVLPAHTNMGTGMDAPNGVVVTFHSWLEAGYDFGNGRWVSLFTINPTCGYTERVITLGIDQPDGILRPAHHWPEGQLTIEPGAPAMPRGQWVRITAYVNFHTGVMHVWQDGRSVLHVTGITRATKQMCQWHWGLYASANNDDVVLYEDDLSVWKLGEAWTDWSREPYLGETQAVCD